MDAIECRTTGARRWWVLATVVAAQFIFVVDAFIVNVAIPSIRADLRASAAEIEAVIAIYQIAYATMLVTGGRLGDIHGRKPMFLLGLLGFVASSIWCGLAGSGLELIVARLLQGGSAALTSPQVLATIHTLFRDQARAKAFGIFGTALGLGGATGLVLGGWLVTLNLAALGWRTVFFVNVPVGIAIAVAAALLLPDTPTRRDIRLDVPGATLLFLGLLALIAPILCGRDLRWAAWLFLIEAGGAMIIIAFIRLERATEARGGAPLIDLALLSDGAFMRGLGAIACLFAGNLSFYLIVTLFLQGGLGMAPFDAGVTMLPLAIAFVIGSRHGSAAVARLGVRALTRGCIVQFAGIACTVATIMLEPDRAMAWLMPPLALFGYGQGLVMAPLFGTVLASVRHAHAGSGAGILTTTQQIANGTGVALIGAVYFAVQGAWSDRAAVTIALCVLAVIVLATAGLLERMRRIAAPDLSS